MRPHEIDPEKPGLIGLLRGEGERSMRSIAWFGVFFLLGFVPYITIITS